MAKLWYPAVLDRDPQGGFGVIFPDLPGCFSSGKTAGEAARMAEEALAGHLEVLAELDQPIPPASEIDRVRVDPEIAEAGRVLIGVEEPRGGERVNVWLRKSLLSRIDRHVAETGAGGSRSGFLAQAAKEFLARRSSEVSGA